MISEMPSSTTSTPVPEEERNEASDPIREWCNQISTTHLRQNKRSEANAQRQADDLLGESSHLLSTNSTFENLPREIEPAQPPPVDCRVVFHPEADCHILEGMSSSIKSVSHQLRCMSVTA